MKNSMRSATAPRNFSARVRASDNASGNWIDSDTTMIRMLLRKARPKARLSNTKR